MLSLTLLPLPPHLPLQPFPAHAGKNVSGGDAVDRLCERAPSLEIKGDSCFMARRTKGARSKETVAKKKTKQKPPSPWITQALQRAALCKQRTHFPPRYDDDAEWRPPSSQWLSTIIRTTSVLLPHSLLPHRDAVEGNSSLPQLLPRMEHRQPIGCQKPPQFRYKCPALCVLPWMKPKRSKFEVQPPHFYGEPAPCHNELARWWNFANSSKEQKITWNKAYG